MEKREFPIAVWSLLLEIDLPRDTAHKLCRRTAMTPEPPDSCKHYLMYHEMGFAQLLVGWICLWWEPGQRDHACSPNSPMEGGTM